MASGNFFHVLGAAPLLGRTIAPADETAPGANPVAVVSYRYWQDKLGSDAGVIGHTLTINRTLFTIVGVMPPQFYGIGLNPHVVDLWVPLTMQPQVTLRPSLLEPQSLYWLHFLGRRRAGISLQAAQSWLAVQLRQMMLAREGAQASASRRQEIEHTYVELLPGVHGVSRLRAQYREPLLILMGVVVLVLLIACANLANFLLARASAREAETATRLALGATRAGIVRQVLTEALLLSLGGGLLGLGLAIGGTRCLVHMVMMGAAQTSLSVMPDLHVLVFTCSLSLLTGVLFGLVPALRVSRMTAAPVMKANARTAAGSTYGGRRWLPKLLVMAQVVLSLVLLAGAGLFLRTLRNLDHQNFGFHRDHLLLVQFNPKFAGYTPEQLNALYDEMLSRISVLPGVRSAAISGNPPIGPGAWASPLFIQGRTRIPGKHDFSLFSRVSADYFQTVGIPVLQGRPIEPTDRPNTLQAAVVNETLAQELFPKGDAIGQSFTVADPGVKGSFRIVGVVRGAKFNSPREKPQRMVYLPVEQLTGDDAYAYCLQIRTAGDAKAVTGEVRNAMTAINPDLAMLQVRTIIEQVDDSIGNERMISQFSSLFALLALGLACMGLYGVMTYNVMRRTNEIGIRLALGAPAPRVLGMILAESLRMLAIGVAIGLPLTLVLTRLVRSQLFGVSAGDPVTLAAAVVVIAAVLLGAAWFPARRAMKVDPMVALRYE
jgi:predicted permease